MPELASEGLTGTQIQVPKTKPKEWEGTQIQAPEMVTSSPLAVSSSVFVKDIDGLSSLVLADLGAIFRIGP